MGFVGILQGRPENIDPSIEEIRGRYQCPFFVATQKNCPVGDKLHSVAEGIKRCVVLLHICAYPWNPWSISFSFLLLPYSFFLF